MTEPLLRVENLSRHFDHLAALKGVTFTLEAGEVLGVVGRPGAGKSTLLHILCGVYPPSGGRIFFAGHPLSLSHPREAQRMGIEVVYQHPQLMDDEDVVHNIFLGHEITTRYGLGQLNFDQMVQQTRSLLADFDLRLPSRLQRRRRKSHFRVKTQLRFWRITVTEEDVEWHEP